MFFCLATIYARGRDDETKTKLHQMTDEVLAVAGQHIDDGNLDHRVAAGLQAHGGAGHVDQHLTCQGGVVDAHVEL